MKIYYKIEISRLHHDFFRLNRCKKIVGNSEVVCEVFFFFINLKNPSFNKIYQGNKIQKYALSFRNIQMI